MSYTVKSYGKPVSRTIDIFCEECSYHEERTIYFNECSQLSYSSIQLARTRLAEKNGLVKRTYYDENPPTKSHWS